MKWAGKKARGSNKKYPHGMLKSVVSITMQRLPRGFEVIDCAYYAWLVYRIEPTYNQMVGAVSAFVELDALIVSRDREDARRAHYVPIQ